MVVEWCSRGNRTREIANHMQDQDQSPDGGAGYLRDATNNLRDRTEGGITNGLLEGPLGNS